MDVICLTWLQRREQSKQVLKWCLKPLGCNNHKKVFQKKYINMLKKNACLLTKWKHVVFLFIKKNRASKLKVKLEV